MSDENMKEAMKQAIKEWMDEKFATLGKWTFSSIAVLAVSALVFFILNLYGWKL